MSAWETLQGRWPWPAEQPPKCAGERDWFGGTKAKTLDRILPQQSLLLIELGSWYGRSALWFCTRDNDNRLVCIDTWLGDAHIRTNRTVTPQIAGSYAGFLHNLWPYRNRVIPLRAATVQGLIECAAARLRPDAIYIDASHDYRSVLYDVETCAELFPTAWLCGDDATWPDVAAAARHVARRFGRTYASDEATWWMPPSI